MKQYLKLSIILSLLLFAGCKSEYGEILSAQKQLVYPGVENAPVHVKYTVKLKINKPVTLKHIFVKRNNFSTEMSHFVLKKENADKVYQLNDKLPSGEYMLITSIPDNFDKKRTQDELIFVFIPENSENAIQVITKVSEAQPIYMQ